MSKPPSNKLTKEIVNERIKDRGIELISEYINNGFKSQFKCEHNHVWTTSPGSIMSAKTGCPFCSGKARLSKDIVNKRLEGEGRNTRIISEYTGALSKSDFQCEFGHIWTTTPASVLNGNDCQICYHSNRRLSKQLVNERLENQGRNTRMVSEYNGTDSKSEFQCESGHIWSAPPNSVMAGHDCPVCVLRGYNVGKPGYIYILDFGYFIKYGITNVLDKRLKEHKKNGEYTIAITKLYEDGNIARKWESSIKILFGGRFVSKDICPDGYTETLSRDKLQALLETVK